MDSLKLWARNGAAVRQAIELGEVAHIETASEELTDEFLLFAIDSGLLQTRTRQPHKSIWKCWRMCAPRRSNPSLPPR